MLYLTNLPIYTYIIIGNVTESLEKWVELFTYGLNAGTNDRSHPQYGLPTYILHTIHQMVGTAAIMYILPTVENSIRNLQCGTVPRGMGNVLGT